MTSPTSLELLRHCLLRQLSSALPASLNAETLSLGLHTAGFELSSEMLHAELLYLAQKGLVETLQKPLNPTARYRLTAAGRDYLQSENLD
jgi:DNA-binding PadR family transcriptional regulator